MTKRVYLAGPITGLTYDEGNQWRQYAASRLAPIEAMSPLRGKEFLQKYGPLTATFNSNKALSTSRGIMTRDFNDCRTSDAILCNLLGAKRVSVGTVMEIAWAHAFQIPLILVMEESGNPHEHAMIEEAYGYRVPTLDEGIAITKSVLLPHEAQPKEFDKMSRESIIDLWFKKLNETKKPPAAPWRDPYVNPPPSPRWTSPVESGRVPMFSPTNERRVCDGGQYHVQGLAVATESQ